MSRVGSVIKMPWQHLAIFVKCLLSLGSGGVTISFKQCGFECGIEERYINC